ncbi:MAG: DSD1 family PLP-dependent enzyme [Caldilineaceae bacterium]|nr:DSD1 family PLP-dependent enzyme [Caldilineaceae bacterium]
MSEIGLRKEALDTPVLWVDLDRLERNIANLAAFFRQAGIGWRPHTKAVKSPALAHKLIKAGAFGVTCAKLGEAEVMAAAGIQDILVANQVVGPQKLTRLVNLQPHADVKVLVDNPENIAAIGAAATAKGVTVGVLVEVNVGMDRAGVLPGEPTVALAKRIADTPGLAFRGLQTWEGHTLSLATPDEKQRSIEQCIARFTETAQQCRDAGLPVEIVSAGGSGTYQVTPFLPGVTEIEAGGAIYCDVTYQQWGVALEPALFVQSVVTSRPAPERVICDAGFKTLPRGFASPQVLGIDGVKGIVFSAEHGIIGLDAPNTTLKVGDIFDILVGYSDATVFLHDHMYGIRQGTVETVWPILGRGKLR